MTEKRDTFLGEEVSMQMNSISNTDDLCNFLLK